MKKRLIYTALFSIITALVLASVSFNIINWGLAHVNKDDQGNINYAFSGKERYNVGFIGSSRVYYQINPSIFDSITHLTSYNAGIDGLKMPEMEIIAKKYIASHKGADYLVLSIDEFTLTGGNSVWDFPRYFPYVSDTSIYKLSKYQGEIALAKYLPAAALTYYNDPMKSLGIQGFIKPVKKFTTTKLKGSASVKANNQKINPAIKVEYSYNESCINILNRLCSYCQNQNINIVIIVPPILRNKNTIDIYKTGYSQKINDIANRYNIPIIDCSHNAICYKPEMFCDVLHLNDKGADIYTKTVATEFMKREGNTIEIK